MTEPNNKWRQLCEEHDVARERYYRAHAAVASKFGAIASGEATCNPTQVELDEREAAWDAWEDVKQRMDEFVKANT